MNHDAAPAGAGSQRERMLAGELYIADDPHLAADSMRALRLSKLFNDSAPDDAEHRRRLLAELLGSLGEDSEIRPPLFCDYGYQIHIGRAHSSTSASWRSMSPGSSSATTCRSVPTCSC